MVKELDYESQSLIKSVGQRIEKRRKDLGYSVNELGDITGLGGPLILEYEKGVKDRLDLDLIKKIAQGLDLEPRDLLDLDNGRNTAEFSLSYLTRAANMLDKFNNLTDRDKKRVEDYIEVLEGNEKYLRGPEGIK